MNKQQLFAGCCVVFFLVSTAAVHAEEPASETQKLVGEITALPLQYSSVEGNQNKYHEAKWDKEGYEGGIENFELESKNLPKDIHVSADGHALINNDDYEINALVEKKDLGYVKLEYQEFMKYYDDTGGTYYPFARLETNSLNRELGLKIGKFRVETGITFEDYPHIAFAYERHYKDGTKSHLTWTPTVENGVTRNIGPSFQTINEVVDSVELIESHTIKGFDLKGKQAFEWSSAELSREEQSLSYSTTASEKKIRVQNQEPQYHLFTTTESAERWFKEDKVYAGTAYHYTTLKNNEMENIFEMNENRSVTNFSNPKQIRNARADNEYQDHAWTGSVMVTPLSWLNVTTKLRSELMDRSGNSSYPSDTTPAAAGGAVPDGVINNTELSRTEDRAGRIGEGLALRITAIPKTAIYNEFDFEQVRNWLSEDRDSIAGQSVANTGEIFGRETIVYVSRGIWTIGAQFYPVNWLNWTTHFRLNRANADYDDKRETISTSSGQKSAFMDAMNTQTNEFATRFTFKVKPWLKPALRYQYQVRDYDTRVEDLTNVQTTMASHIFTYEVTLQPRPNLLIVTAISPQYGSVVTPARNFGDGNTPRFQSNVLTWLSNANYDLNDHVGLFSGLQYAHANNWNDSTQSGLPLGAAFSQMDVFGGVDWKLTEMISLITQYTFMHYAGSENVDGQSYNGNMISMSTKFKWG